MAIGEIGEIEIKARDLIHRKAETDIGQLFEMPRRRLAEPVDARLGELEGEVGGKVGMSDRKERKSRKNRVSAKVCCEMLQKNPRF